MFFRDTAHGFLTWAVASLIGALIVGSAVSSAVGTGARAVATVASGAAQGGGAAGAQLLQGQQYGLDSLFRGAKPDAASPVAEARAETARILANGMRSGEVPAADRTYLAEMIATRTGLAPAEAQKRVDDAIAQAKAAETQIRQAADTARKSASAAAFFTALSMLIGALIASAAAAFGGSQRDEHE